MADIVSQEIGEGIILHKRVDPSYQNYEILDQTNFYSIETSIDKEVEITVDITGSEGAAFEGTYQTTKNVKLQPHAYEEVAQVKLFGDWLLRIKFTYTIKNFGKGSAIPKSLSLPQNVEMINPTDLPSLIQFSKQLFEFFPYDIMPLDAIRKKLKENNINFVDIEFPPVESSIYPPSEGKPYNEPIVWKRPKDFMVIDEKEGLNPPEVFYKKIEPNDIKQGSLGDCWLMCALGSLAEMPYLVERLFITQKYSEDGLYRVKLCKNGEWMEATIDDYFPCTEHGGPMFSRANGNELWVLLLEKAYAKIHGNYYTLRGGFANEGMMDLTGSPTECFDFEDPNCQEQLATGEFFKKLKQFDESGYLISASTAGEDRWTETGGPTQAGGLVPGHAYSIIQVKEAYNNQLVNVRNPWGTFEWDGEWSDNHKNWTDQMVAAIKPVFGDDGTFWMSFKDFTVNFRALNVCKVSDWEEVRVKGEFSSKISDQDNLVRSRFYYEIQVPTKQRVLIGIHQEDERIQDIIKRKNYMTIGLSILQRNARGGFDLIFMKEFSAERQVELDIELDQGEYLILPRTSGCNLKRPPAAKAEYIKILDGNGELNPLAELVIRDIFRRLDKVMINNILEYSEFQEFYARLNVQLTEQDFQRKILSKFCNNEQGGINRRGFLEFWKDAVRTQGESSVWRWFEKWGYDKDLYPFESRCFMLTIHSMKPIAIQIEEATPKKDYDELVNKMIIERFGEELESKPNAYRLLYKFYEPSYTFSYAIENIGTRAIELTLDCTSSRNMVFSEATGKLSKVVEPGCIEFFMHAEAASGAEEFARGAQCTYREVY